MAEIQLFMFDIDGTISSTEQDISEEMIGLLNRLNDAGIMACCNTARSYMRTINLFPCLATLRFCVVNMGSEYRNAKGDLIHIEYISSFAKKIIMKLLPDTEPSSMICYANGEMQPMIYSDDLHNLKYLEKKYYAEAKNCFSSSLGFFNEWRDRDISTIVLRYRLNLIKKVDDQFLRISDIVEINNIEPGTYILTKKGIDKGHGVRYVSKLLGIESPKTAIITAGNDIIDEAMFKLTRGILVGSYTNTSAIYRISNKIELTKLLHKVFFN